MVFLLMKALFSSLQESIQAVFFTERNMEKEYTNTKIIYNTREAIKMG